MADFYDINRSERQRQYFPIKLNERLRQEICFKIALGEPTREIQDWLWEEKGVRISYQGIRGYRYRKKWVRLQDSLSDHVLCHPIFQRLVKESLEAKDKQWRGLRDTFNDALIEAATQNPPQASGFYGAGRLLVKMYERLKQ